MKVFLLLVMFGGGSDGGRYIPAPIVFYTWDECVRAAETISKVARPMSNWQPYGICIEKTEKHS